MNKKKTFIIMVMGIGVITIFSGCSIRENIVDIRSPIEFVEEKVDKVKEKINNIGEKIEYKIEKNINKGIKKFNNEFHREIEDTEFNKDNERENIKIAKELLENKSREDDFFVYSPNDNYLDISQREDYYIFQYGSYIDEERTDWIIADYDYLVEKDTMEIFIGIPSANGKAEIIPYEEFLQHER